MKKVRNFLIVLVSAVICLSVFSFTVYSAASSDEAVLSQYDDKFVPLYTTVPQESEGSRPLLEKDKRENALFYTQTTFLALTAGYLILFKVKGIDHSEKMHRRIKKN